MQLGNLFDIFFLLLYPFFFVSIVNVRRVMQMEIVQNLEHGKRILVLLGEFRVARLAILVVGTTLIIFAISTNFIVSCLASLA